MNQIPFSDIQSNLTKLSQLAPKYNSRSDIRVMNTTYFIILRIFNLHSFLILRRLGLLQWLEEIQHRHWQIPWHVPPAVTSSLRGEHTFTGKFLSDWLRFFPSKSAQAPFIHSLSIVPSLPAHALRKCVLAFRQLKTLEFSDSDNFTSDSLISLSGA